MIILELLTQQSMMVMYNDTFSCFCCKHSNAIMSVTFFFTDVSDGVWTAQFLHVQPVSQLLRYIIQNCLLSVGQECVFLSVCTLLVILYASGPWSFGHLAIYLIMYFTLLLLLLLYLTKFTCQSQQSDGRICHRNTFYIYFCEIIMIITPHLSRFVSGFCARQNYFV